MKEKEDKKTPSPDFIFIENMSGVAACCTRCLTCRNTCKQVLKVDEVKCCGCKLCVCGGGQGGKMKKHILNLAFCTYILLK